MPSAPRNKLTITGLSKVAFCRRGDNPPAGIAIAKAFPTQSHEGGAQVPNEATPTDIQKALTDEIAVLKAQNAAALAKAEAEAAINKANSEEIAKMKEAEAFAKTESRLVSVGISKAMAPHIRAFEKSHPEAAVAIENEMARLTLVANTVSRLTKAIGEGQGESTGPEAKLQKCIADLKKADSSLTDAAARLQAYDSLTAAERAALLTGGN